MQHLHVRRGRGRGTHRSISLGHRDRQRIVLFTCVRIAKNLGERVHCNCRLELPSKPEEPSAENQDGTAKPESDIRRVGVNCRVGFHAAAADAAAGC